MSSLRLHLRLITLISAVGHQDLPTLGADLPPGFYPKTSFTEDLRKRVVSTKGPYELFSVKRDAKVNTGSGKLGDFYPYTQDKPWLAPGMRTLYC